MTQQTILECIECSGSIQISDKMFDDIYQLQYCPYCGSTDIETDDIDIEDEDD